MQKIVILFYLLISFVQLQADDWRIKNLNFNMENDADARDDEAYSYGSSLSVLFLRENIDDSILHIPFTNYKNQDNYISFSYVQQIFTPGDINSSELIEDDRPYAGYTYIQSGLHQSYNNNLKSLIIQIGMVGPSSKMNRVQKFIHSIIGSDIPSGWENQLEDEFTFQINYTQKQYYEIEDILGLDSIFVPQYGFELGNVSTQVYTSALFRWGVNVAKDYGSLPINNNSYNKLPINSNNTYQKKWGYYFNFGMRGNLVLKNIFLDGNSFKDSHSVDKNILTFNGNYGFSITYDKFSLDYIRTYTTKEYKTQDNIYSYGSLLFSYNF